MSEEQMKELLNQGFNFLGVLRDEKGLRTLMALVTNRLVNFENAKKIAKEYEGYLPTMQEFKVFCERQFYFQKVEYWAAGDAKNLDEKYCFNFENLTSRAANQDEKLFLVIAKTIYE